LLERRRAVVSTKIAAQAQVHDGRQTQALCLLENEARGRDDVGILNGAVARPAHARAEQRRFGRDANVARVRRRQAVACR